jgi:hypothetical protein
MRGFEWVVHKGLYFWSDSRIKLKFDIRGGHCHLNMVIFLIVKFNIVLNNICLNLCSPVLVMVLYLISLAVKVITSAVCL